MREGARVRDEDHDRFLRSWTQAQASLAGYVTAVVSDPHQADDVLQNIAVAALRRFPDYDPERPFIAWAMGIAKIEILTLRRDSARAAARFRAETVESLAEVWQELLPEADGRKRALGECLRKVTGRNRELVTLRYERERPLDEIAGELRMSGVAVRVALSRLRAALQACIERRLAAEPP
jgi:RNA polymerase sigma-70 factor (ECF subfamily)